MELYTEKVTLPSGIEATIREMTATEEGFLASPKMLKSGEAFEKILRNCVVEKDIDLDNLLVGDRYYLMLAIRKLTFGDDYDFKVRCASCGHTFNASVNLAELPIKKLDGEPLQQRLLPLHTPVFLQRPSGLGHAVPRHPPRREPQRRGRRRGDQGFLFRDTV